MSADELDLSKHTVEPKPCFKMFFLTLETNHANYTESALPTKLSDNIIDNTSIPKIINSIFDQLRPFGF